jgi:hypothetical protein
MVLFISQLNNLNLNYRFVRKRVHKPKFTPIGAAPTKKAVLTQICSVPVYWGATVLESVQAGGLQCFLI